MQRRTVRGLSASAVLSLALLSAQRLRAQDSGPTLLVYRAADGCPAVAEFQRSVQRRSTRVRFVEQGPHDRELSISMRTEGEATQGELRLVERDGRVSQRSVRFTSCAEAVEGLALIAVVSLDPRALLESKESHPDVLSEPADAQGKTPATPVSPAKAAPKPDSTAQDAAPAARPTKARFALGAAFDVAPSALPEAALGASLFADLALPAPSRFAPLFRLAVSHVERRGLSSPDGPEANFTLTLATVSACPLRLAGGAWEFRPCGFASGGALHAWGSQTSNLQQRTRPYGAAGGSLLLAVSASQTIDMIADLSVGATLLRDSFGFEQEQSWKTPALYLSSRLGARFVFP